MSKLFCLQAELDQLISKGSFQSAPFYSPMILLAFNAHSTVAHKIQCTNKTCERIQSVNRKRSWENADHFLELRQQVYNSNGGSPMQNLLFCSCCELILQSEKEMHLFKCKSEALAQDREDQCKLTGSSSREGVSADFMSERICCSLTCLSPQCYISQGRGITSILFPNVSEMFQMFWDVWDEMAWI